ncbi:hypothetical protein [Gramella sp. AN32]|uniref:Cytochrome c n=1 Tax=Christiangramia antarctica TaxID=2058158 RepID=A0ABW5X392_9FLAO|nr:hypothetical protein [Gramella sp. AN32]MCM4156642.1 hypothetical protein [Gramella sp. AN32]
MKTLYRILIGSLMIFAISISIIACSTKKDVYTEVPDTEVADMGEEFKIEKSGAQLWGEVCNRCHLAPSPADYNDTDWETISLHMRVRANLTEKEITGIKGFLQSAN